MGSWWLSLVLGAATVVAGVELPHGLWPFGQKAPHTSKPTIKLAAKEPSTVRVQAKTGIYIGYSSLTADNKEPYYSFSGVRYAKPVTSSYRFKEADPLEDSNNVYNALKEGFTCIQCKTLYFSSWVIGSEDCLFLNIYTPKLNGSLPVLVVITEGFFSFLGNSRIHMAPDYFMETKDVLLITMNYRLGPFGFANFNSREFPANLGLKDQVIALKWIQRNIEYFGGNPKRVTLLGMSAGATCVHLHMISPLSKGLFHAGISESGTALNPWAVQAPYHAWRSLRFVAVHAGCGHALPDYWTNNADKLALCLKRQSAVQIMEAVQHFDLEDLFPLFLPVVEFGVKDGFLVEDPWVAPESDTPWLIGVNSDEGALPEGADSFAYGGPIILPFCFYVLQNMLGYKDTAADPLRIDAKLINHILLQSFPPSFNPHHLFNQVLGYLGFYYPNYEALRKHNGTVFSYVFGYKKTFKNGSIINPSRGVGHGEEFPYLFPRDSDFIRHNGSHNDVIVSKILVRLWTNFVLEKHPSKAQWTFEGWNVPEWPQWDKNNNLVLLISQKNMTVVKDPRLGEYSFYRNLPYRNKLRKS